MSEWYPWHFCGSCDNDGFKRDSFEMTMPTGHQPQRISKGGIARFKSSTPHLYYQRLKGREWWECDQVIPVHEKSKEDKTTRTSFRRGSLWVTVTTCPLWQWVTLVMSLRMISLLRTGSGHCIPCGGWGRNCCYLEAGTNPASRYKQISSTYYS